MKIGIDIRPLQDRNYSGVAEYTYNLISEILKQDHDNQYLLFCNSFSNISGNLPDFKARNCKIIKYSWPNKLLNFCFKFFNWPKIDKLLGVELFIVPNINFIALSKKCRKIIVIHDLSFFVHQEFFNLKRRLWHWFVDVKKIIKNYDDIVCVSENTKEDVLEICEADPKKVHVVYPGLSPIFELQNSELNGKQLLNIKSKYCLPEKFILSLSTIEPRKNISGIIKAYCILREKKMIDDNIKLVIAGAKGWRGSIIFKDWKNSNYKNDIIFIGYVPREEKKYLYLNSLLFVYPSFYEGFGFPPIEALSCGVPVITSSFSSLPEVVENSALLVDPYNINSIAQAMEILINNMELRNKYKIMGLRQSKKFRWGKAVFEFLTIIKNKQS